MVQKVQKVVDVPQIEVEEQVVEVPVAKHVQVPMIQKVQKIVETWPHRVISSRCGTSEISILVFPGLGCGFPLRMCPRLRSKSSW